MSAVVAVAGTSHAAMLAPNPAEVWALRAGQDRHDTELYDVDGVIHSYVELEARAGGRYDDELSVAVWEEKWERSHKAIARLRADILALEPDLIVIVGDDQRELFDPSNQPAVALFAGDSMTMQERPLPPELPKEEADAMRRFLVALGSDGRTCPADGPAGYHFIARLVADGFDVSTLEKAPEGRGFGHAYGWVLGPLLGDPGIPAVPVMLNTYFPPNQPTPSRCFDLGVALRRAAESLPGNRRVVIVASGGLSHFVINRPLDEAVLIALRDKDEAALRSIPAELLNSGTSEIRNWIVAGGALGSLTARWTEYVPAYRSPAGTGTGLAFGCWA